MLGVEARSELVVVSFVVRPAKPADFKRLAVVVVVSVYLPGAANLAGEAIQFAGLDRLRCFGPRFALCGAASVALFINAAPGADLAKVIHLLCFTAAGAFAFEELGHRFT
jgi:hypothetical protein